ncbi:cell division protein ZipA [Vibrio algicola]|uniref:Cell division protein ZipA n=1 Tax=Vibrio algicola TaxID=2662262 RepID=A0A5Q0TDP5_9VIBR|nr:cell division protein ZipA [Vibrio algicola]
MHELRLVLIIVGGLLIIALLAHGIMSNRKEGKSKFADKPLSKLKEEQEPSLAAAPVVKARKEPEFNSQDPLDEHPDPLFGESDVSFASSNKFSATDNIESVVIDNQHHNDGELNTNVMAEQDPLLAQNDSFSTPLREQSHLNEPISVNELDTNINITSDLAPADYKQPVVEPVITKPDPFSGNAAVNNEQEPVQTATSDDALEVIVLHVHAAGSTEFNGTELFSSMNRNGLFFGAMDIFHYHEAKDSNGKVLFSVANMMKPGTLVCDDPDQFSTKGISFFMALSGYGDSDQTFTDMLRTAQQIADDLGANVLDDQRKLMTPNRLSTYRQQIRQYINKTFD